MHTKARWRSRYTGIYKISNRLVLWVRATATVDTTGARSLEQAVPHDLYIFVVISS